MPTGYTSKIYDGETQTFGDFAMSCARAFGWLATMRDEPRDAPIPFTFEPSNYSVDAMDRDRQALREIESLSTAECDRRANAEFDDAVASRQKHIAENNELKQRYEAMLAQVEAWVPPSSEHTELKSFMSQQLRESIKWDCSDYYERNVPVLKSGEEWRRDRIEVLAASIARSTEQWEKDRAYAAGRTRWVRALRASL